MLTCYRYPSSNEAWQNEIPAAMGKGKQWLVSRAQSMQGSVAKNWQQMGEAQGKGP